MILSNKIFFLKVGIALAIIFLIAFTGAFYSGIQTISDSEKWSNHTNKVLDRIAEVQRTVEVAEHAGRLMIVNPELQPEVPPLREVAIKRIADLEPLVSYSPEQTENLANVKAATLARFTVQDRQVAEVLRQPSGGIVFSRELLTETIDSVRKIETAFTTLRVAEINLLYNRDFIRSRRQWAIIYTMTFCLVLMLAGIAFMLYALFEELRIRRDAVASLNKMALHNSDITNAGGLTAPQVHELLDVIKQGEQQFKKIYLF